MQTPAYPPAATLEEVRARLRAALPMLRSRYGVASLAVFGSFARGEQRDDSDVDVLAAYDRPLNLLELGALLMDLQDALGRPVDLANRDRLRPAYRRGILEDAVEVARA
jgi:uncharacterized protein